MGTVDHVADEDVGQPERSEALPEGVVGGAGRACPASRSSVRTSVWALMREGHAGGPLDGATYTIPAGRS